MKKNDEWRMANDEKRRFSAPPNRNPVIADVEFVFGHLSFVIRH